MPYCEKGLNRLIWTLVHGDSATELEPSELRWLWMVKSELKALIEQTRTMLKDEIATLNRKRLANRQRPINVCLYLSLFDAVCTGSLKSQVGRDRGCTRQRVNGARNRLHKFESVRHFIAALQERIALHELSHSYVSQFSGDQTTEAETELAESNGLPG